MSITQFGQTDATLNGMELPHARLSSRAGQTSSTQTR